MKKIFLLLALVLALPFSVMSQDARNRTSQTIVADALAQLPVANQNNYEKVMGEIAGTGADGIKQLASMLVPADKGENATVEHALNGVVAYVSAPGREAECAEVRKGLIEAIKTTTDNPNRAFLMTLLRNCATTDDVAVFESYVSDPYLREWAIAGLTTLPGGEDAILRLIENNGAPNDVLANAAGSMKIAAAEPVIINWAKEVSGRDAAPFYRALGNIGGSKSVSVLSKAAKKQNYSWEPDAATESYVILLNNMVANGNVKEAVSAAKKLMKDADKPNVRSAALQIITSQEGKKAIPVVIKALSDPDRGYRVNALRLAQPFADNDLYEELNKILASKNETEVKADIINWYGANHVESQIDAILPSFKSSNAEVAQAAVAAAGRIGGEKALNELVALLNGPLAKEASAALLSFNGKVNPGIVQALTGGDSATKIAALKIASERRMTEAANMVFMMLDSDDKNVSAAAYEALPGVVSQNDFPRLCVLVEKDGGVHIKTLQSAIKSALRNFSPDAQYAAVEPFLKKSKTPSVFYPLLAQSATPDAIKALLESYDSPNSKSAFEALLTVNSPEMTDVMYGIATASKANKADAAQALSRYTRLVSQSSLTPERKYQLYRKAIEATNDPAVQNQIINGLGNVATYPSFLTVEKYISNSATAAAAAEALRSIASKNMAIMGGSYVKSTLEKAVAQFRSQTDNPDAGYAVDDINGMLAKISETGFEPLRLNIKDVKFLPMSTLTGLPIAPGRLKGIALKKAENAAIKSAKDWTVNTVGITYSGTEKTAIALPGDYENFDLIFEWKGDGILGLRSIPAIKLGGKNSGTVIANAEPNAAVDNAMNSDAEWNTAYVRMVNDRVTVIINGIMVTDNLILENPASDQKYVYPTGAIEFVSTGKTMEVRDLYLRQLPSTPVFELSAEEAADGFKALFDGRSMHNFIGNTVNYIPVDGNIVVSAQYGSGGNLYTVDEYSDFILRFEFCFDREGVNNGIGIRTPMGVDAAYYGMEIQVLDHDAPIYKDLREYQQHGSVYGIIPAKRVKFPARGSWNTEEIRAVGDHITVTVNGEVILDGDIREATQGHNVAPDGADRNPYTVDHLNHPGLFNKSGHIGFLGHGTGIKFRNIRVKDLSSESK